MGMVKIDIHKDELFYEQLTLSDPNVIRFLIEYRYKYDPYYMMEQERDINVAGNAKPLIQEAIALYASLDETIKKCKFKKRQLDLIKYVEMGYELSEIPKIDDRFNQNRSIYAMFNNIIKKIKAVNDEQWYISVYKHKLQGELKTCSKCKKELPKNEKFFYTDKRAKDGLYSNCKKM